MFAKKKSVMRRVRQVGHKSANAMMTRKDIGCGIVDCALCKEAVHAGRGATILPHQAIIIPDTNVVLHNMNALEDVRIQNIVFLSTVLSEVQNRNKGIYSRLQRLMADESKQCYVFANDRHEQTHCVLLKNESANDFNDRCIRVASQWYARHVCSAFGPTRVVLITYDKALRQQLLNKQTCETNELNSTTTNANESEQKPSLPSNLSCLGLREFISTVIASDCDLLEKVQYEMPEGMKENSSTHQIFIPYKSESSLEVGVQKGVYLKGKLRVSETSCFFGEIRGKFDGHAFDRVLLPGRVNLNRAIHGDTVCVEVRPVSEWRPAKKINNNDSDIENDNITPATEADALAAHYTPVGRVVGICNMRRRPFCGSIDVEEVKRMTNNKGEINEGSVSVLFQPKDSRIPRIRISTSHLSQLHNKRLSVVIDDWPLYSSFPLGHYVEVLGTIGDRDTEATVILLENDIPHYDFSEGVYNCLPKGQWHVTDDEVCRRLDLRDLCVVSVDPLGCRDIDDALHCRVLDNGHYEVGVHIADVTHFVHEHTLMDEEAAKRSTSVYLVDRRINMLPQLLTENLCSLVYNEDRYAFSILWEFDSSFNVVHDWFGKTIIRSRGALYYGDAQRMIDDVDDHSEIASSLRRLMQISKHFKSQREANGALFLASQEFKFKVDDAHLNPTDMQSYQTFEANSMIEEWMLFANAAAASKCVEHFPRWTLLRRHERPAEGAFDTLNTALERKLHKRLDDTSSLTLNKSLDDCVDEHDAYFNKLIRILTTRCLRQAQYFSSGSILHDEYYHFGLAMPIYTHFTSPIRRYADVMVHRQLAAALGIAEVSATHMDAEKMEQIAENINYRHEQAQRAGRDSQNLFTGFYLRNFENGVIPSEDGYVVRLTETHVFVLVPRYGQESRIPKDSLCKVPELLDKVQVGIEVRRYGDALNTKLIFTLIGYMRDDATTTAENKNNEEEEEKGGVLVADDVNVLDEGEMATEKDKSDITCSAEITVQATTTDTEKNIPIHDNAKVEGGKRDRSETNDECSRVNNDDNEVTQTSNKQAKTI